MNPRKQIAITGVAGKKVLVYMENDRMMDIVVEQDAKNDGPAVGNIYVGKVKNIVKNISAAFVEIEKGVLCYLPLSKEEESAVRCGDEIVVQVTKPAVKTKQAVVSRYPEFVGKYAVVSTKDDKKGISKKITDEETRARLKEVLDKFAEEPYGVVLRTAAEKVSAEILETECREIIRQAHDCMDAASYRTCFTLLRGEELFCLSYLYGCNMDTIDRIITDDFLIYRTLCDEFSERFNEKPDFIVFYEDDSYSLDHLLGITSKIKKEALAKRVWLKSGGNIVIEHTEALTVIDVNTGKAIEGKRNRETTFFKINSEAALEVARQLRIRNISGIIIIDFIDMKKEENRKKLLELLREELKKDKTKASLIDITGLGLAELTRMKKKKPLRECIKIHEDN